MSKERRVTLVRKLNMKASQQGITLVALVITIVIIIILATVTINMAFGDNGLIKQAELARDMAANSTRHETESMANLTAYMNDMMKDNIPEEPFTPQETPEPEQGETELSSADKTNGVIEIKWLSGTTNNVTETPNAPVIKTEGLPSGTTMELVRYTGEGDTERERWVAGTEYSYLPGEGSSDNTSSKWANARVTIDGVDSYFVWIPRYAYRIIYFDSADSKIKYQNGEITEEEAIAQGKIKGYSDSRGIVDSEGKKVANAESTTKTMVSEDYFMVHPAFTADPDIGGGFGNNNGTNDNGISGIWVGKYETSGSSSQLKVEAGVSSLRSTAIANMYTYSKAYSTELESHMLKNSEWGAVAYLTESQYGRNGTEVTINNNGMTYYTGGGQNNAYVTNTPQSSTGNVYGIYDLSGNAYEYVAAGYSNQSDIETTSGSTKYATVYGGTNVSTNYKYGDATYETIDWHQDYAYFVDSSGPFFNRGGYCNDGEYAGVFYFSDGNGSSYSNYSFRLALVV